jgi:uncharacterized MAPEG superfamily protein
MVARQNAQMQASGAIGFANRGRLGDVMSVELCAILACAAVFASIILVQGVIANRIFKPAELLGARDGLPVDQGKLGRARRAGQNTLEAFAVFIPATLVVELTGQQSLLTAIACVLFVLARIVYVPAYILDPPNVRSLVWFVGFIASIVMLIAALPG